MYQKLPHAIFEEVHPIEIQQLSKMALFKTTRKDPPFALLLLAHES
jgi:hypothetical protein